MPFSTERTALIKAKLDDRLTNDSLNDWERSFLTDMNAKFDLYGELAAAGSAFAPLSPEWRALPDAFDAPDHTAISVFRDLMNADHTPPDPNIMNTVYELYTEPFTRLSQSDLADAPYQDQTQALRHFKATTGQTFRRFKIWAAIVSAIRSAHQGEQIGLAGIEIGSSDAAHLARTASTVFGVTPTAGLFGLTGIVTLPSIASLPQRK